MSRAIRRVKEEGKEEEGEEERGGKKEKKKKEEKKGRKEEKKKKRNGRNGESIMVVHETVAIAIHLVPFWLPEKPKYKRPHHYTLHTSGGH